ncbi:MAG: protein-L-isoaspartate(D-aspartate) O-methyltransferase [Clostridiales bacterium]|nr:protein-L-isoaspartate(D-aspartate) O-methyltransferase [Clostridiales bacterium]
MIKIELIEFFKSLDRRLFLEKNQAYASMDIPLDIGYGQTISQPSLVLEMTDVLDLTSDSKVLEIGTGSGYQTVFLAKFSNHVFTIERIEALYEKAKERLNVLGYDNVSYKLGDGSLGWEEHAPFDRIIVTSSAFKIPSNLLEQLATNGKMLIPIGEEEVQKLLLVTKDSHGKINQESLGYVRFVRLLDDEGRLL